MAAPDITYEELKDDLSTITLFDVRNRDEVEKHGQIPGSHCVPMTELAEALALDEDSFKNKYGVDKPSSDTVVATHCMMGGRARKAADLLTSHGLANIKCYKGSFKDWVANGGDIINPGKPFQPES